MCRLGMFFPLFSMLRDLYSNEYLFFLSQARLLHLISVISLQLSQFLHVVLMQYVGIFILLVDGFDPIVNGDQSDAVFSKCPANSERSLH